MKQPTRMPLWHHEWWGNTTQGIALEKLERLKNAPWASFLLKYYPLIIALIVTSIHYMLKPDMYSVSGDAVDIWKTITSWHSGDVYGSYVLYKGFESVYPYVWFYDLSMALHVDPWLFIKIYYLVMFSVSTTVLLPKIVEKLTGKSPKNYAILILFAVCYLFWIPAGALIFMVDLPSLFYFLVLIFVALCFDEWSKSIWYWISLGVLMGLNLCSSGQYTLPVVAVAIYLLLKMKKSWKGPDYRINWAMCIPMIVIALAIREYNAWFLDVIVGGLRDAGAWIPSSNDWLQVGFLRLMPTYRQGLCVQIYCDRGLEVMQNYFGSIYDMYKDDMIGGRYPISIGEYLNIVIHEPLDCLAMYGATLFLMVSPDRGYLSFFPLLISFTLLFIAIRYGVSKCKTVKQLFSPKSWIVVAFFFALVPCLVLVYDPRHAFQLQGLIFAVALCTPLLWETLARIPEYWKDRKEKKWPCQINYVVVSYVVFLFFCFVMIALLYENSNDPSFYWWK